MVKAKIEIRLDPTGNEDQVTMLAYDHVPGVGWVIGTEYVAGNVGSALINLSSFADTAFPENMPA